MSYGIYATNESGFVQIDSEYDNLAILTDGIALATFSYNFYGGDPLLAYANTSYYPPYTINNVGTALAEQPVDDGQVQWGFGTVTSLYGSYDKEDYGWHQLPDNTPEDYAIFIRPIFPTNMISYLDGSHPNKWFETSRNPVVRNNINVGTPPSYSYVTRTNNDGTTSIKFICPHENAVSGQGGQAISRYFWDSRLLRFAIAIKHSDWIAINGDPTAEPNIQLLAEVSTIHVHPTWVFGSIPGTINQKLVNTSGLPPAIGPPASMPGYLNIRPEQEWQRQLTTSTEYGIGFEFNPETKELSFEWWQDLEDINPFAFISLTGDLTEGLEIADITFRDYDAVAETITEPIYFIGSSAPYTYGSTQSRKRWTWITTDAFRDRVINNNYITYTINIYAATPWFGLDVHRADGGLCYSSETPQMRVFSTSSTRVENGVNWSYPQGINPTEFLRTYHEDGKDIYALLKPFKDAGFFVSGVPLSSSNWTVRQENWFVEFQYGHSTFTSYRARNGYGYALNPEADVEANRLVDPSVDILTYTMTSRITAAARAGVVAYASNEMWDILGSKTMITGKIV